jgi:hypothetical protein
MIVYKIYLHPKFEEVHTEYFNSLLEAVKQHNFLSPNIKEIIITDDLDGELERYCKNRFRQPNLTRTREFKGIAKTIDFEGKKTVFFDAVNVNGFVKYAPQIFFEQLIEIYAEDLVSHNFKVPNQFSLDTPLTEIIKMHFSQWATKVVANVLEKMLSIPQEEIHTDVKIFVDAFKRNMRRLHYKYQGDISLDEFWKMAITEVDFFVRRCFDVKFDDGTFTNLQEFSELIPTLLSEIQIQTQNLLEKKEIDFTIMREQVLLILNKCSIDIPYESRMNVKIMETPKKLFRNNIVDTEPRIVAFIDILGFSAIIEEYDSDNQSNILNQLHDTLEMAIKISIENITDQKAKTDLKEYLEYRMFSDCLCLSLPYIEFGNDFHIQFHSLATIVKVYQLTMMQKGFFVRGGISMGSFYADKNMIFSGGLVSAYKLEQAIVYPVIGIDRKVIERLKIDFAESSKGLFYENIMLFTNSEPEKVFLNPFDLLDNSIKYFDYLQSAMDNLIKSNEEDKDDPLTKMTSSLLELTNTFVKPIFDYAKSKMTPENMNAAKEKILEYVNEQLTNHNSILLQNEPDSSAYKEAKKILVKYAHLKTLTEWSMGKVDSDLFKYYNFS